MPEIVETNVSRAWQKAAILANAAPKKEVKNLIVNIEKIASTDDFEDDQFRSNLDSALENNGNFTVSTVSNTIFPISLWRPDAPRQVLYERYLNLWPRIIECQQNRRGTYFQRLIGYPRQDEPSFNQLEHVISAYRSGIRRRSTFQCGIIYPPTDLNATPFQGFPCMQQVAFHPEGNGGLRVSALYPMHYLWARAYGNYVGLINLGKFVAKEMGLRLETLTCIALVAKLDDPNQAGPFLGDTI